MKATPKLVSLVIPVLNEESNIPALHERLSAVADALDGYTVEMVFTDNHSTDGTFPLLEQLAAKDARVRAFRFSRNFGFQRSILAGMRYARGDAAIQLDADMQDPPEMIPEMIRKWEEGNQVVYGIRTHRQEGRGIQFVRRSFYRIINGLSDTPLPVDAGDFRLMDRVVLDQLAQINEPDPYIRGAVAEMGFNQVGIPYRRDARTSGESKFNLGSMVSLAVDGILNHSTTPLRVATWFGLAVSLLTVLASIGYLIARFVTQSNWPAGFATTTVLILLSLSINALFLGIIGEYIGRIFRAIRPRPLVILETSTEPRVERLTTEPESVGP